MSLTIALIILAAVLIFLVQALGVAVFALFDLSKTIKAETELQRAKARLRKAKKARPVESSTK